MYKAYGLLPDDCELATPLDGPPPLMVGERAFEIVLARKAQEGLVSTTWFDRHGAIPVTEVPEHWPTAYRDLVQARIEAIEQHAFLGTLEKPEHKRRWASPGWHQLLQDGLRERMLDRCEGSDLWFETKDGVRYPVARTVDQLAKLLEDDAEFVMLAARHSPGTRVLNVLQGLLSDTHVPAAPPAVQGVRPGEAERLGSCVGAPMGVETRARRDSRLAATDRRHPRRTASLHVCGLRQTLLLATTRQVRRTQ